MHSVLFKIGSLTVYTYGLFLAAAFALGIWFAQRKAPYSKVTPESVVDLSITIIISSIIGARLLYVFVEWDEFAAHPIEMLYIHRGGLVFYGGLIGASIGTIAFCFIRGLRLWKMADIMAPSVALGQALGRIGCFFNGCCYGHPSDYGIIFPEVNQTVKYFPIQLVEAAGCFIIFFILSHVFYRKKFHGQGFFLYLILYSILRFSLEFLRGDDRGGFFLLHLSISQIISIIGISVGAALYAWHSKKYPIRK